MVGGRDSGITKGCFSIWELVKIGLVNGKSCLGSRPYQSEASGCGRLRLSHFTHGASPDWMPCLSKFTSQRHVDVSFMLINGPQAWSES